jgi:ring-1,2-phenylacetyl-CoA epoxidase subunit PaaB
MNDTQWPRFQVFLQEKDGSPYQDVGSVHAADPELALYNARDVFVRRPEATGLWVAPASSIFSKTAEELPGWLQESHPEPETETGKGEPYHIFCKYKSAGTQTHYITLEATSPEQALQKAVEGYSGQKRPFVWWAISDKAITRNDPQDAESFFTPALDKPFRLSTDFHTHTAMRDSMGRKKSTSNKN